MNAEEFIIGLSAEASEAVGQLLRRAYDTGFREGLASAGQASPVAEVAVAPPDPASAPPVEWAGGEVPEPDEGPAGDDEEDESASAIEVAPVRPILPTATIATLRRRIMRTFDLERFEIDVVICRSGDTDRRQLKSSARLGLYRREER